MSERLTQLVPIKRPKTIWLYYLQVRGLPGAQGSKRHVGKGRMIEMSKKVTPWREAVKAEALADRLKRRLPPIEGPVFLSVTFTLPKPKSAPKTRRLWPARAPDLDKLARSTNDALTEAGVWLDDAQVVEYRRLAKVYPNEGEDALDSPGATIIIYKLDPQA